MKALDSLKNIANLTVQDALQIAKNYLKNFSLSPNFKTQMQIALGNLKNWATTDLTNFPKIEVRPGAEINQAKGAFAAATNTIYLSQELVDQNRGNVDDIASVLLEEYGHYLDSQVNPIDSPGDEGAIFADLVQGKALSQGELAALKAEDDSAIVVLDGEEVRIEQAENVTKGEVSDSGGYEGSQKTLKLDSKGGGKAEYSYEMFQIPDNLILRYEGKNILDTGFVSGSKTGKVDIPNGNSDQLEVVLATNDEGTQWNYTVSTENSASLVFRELDDGAKDNTWGGRGDDVPGWDHVGLSFNDQVYESHPGYESGQYWDIKKEEFVPINKVNGPQQEHTIGSFEHDSTIPNSTKILRYQELEIPISLGKKMIKAIEPQIGNASFQSITEILRLLKQLKFKEAFDLLSPANQKGENGKFTCVGLVEWAAEQAGHNGGQGFIPNELESFRVGNVMIPFLSPELLAVSVRPDPYTILVDGIKLTQWIADQVINQVPTVVDKGKKWVQGLFDPVDFIVTDPLGRRLGHTAALGTINEIPGAFYTGDGSLEQFMILDALPGEYKVEQFGLGQDAVAAIGGSSTEGLLVSEFLGQGETRTFSVTVPQEGSGNGIADLSISRTGDSPAPVNLGENITYNLVVTNNSPTAATDVTLTDNLPSGMNFVSATPSRGTVSEANGVFTADLGNLNSGETATVAITVTPIASGVIAGTASVVANEADPNTTNNLIIHGRTVNAVAPAPVDLELTKTVSNSNPNVGDQITFALTLTNKGQGIASSIKVADILPPGLSFISANSVQGTYDSNTGIWDVGNMRDNLTRTLNISAQVNTPGSIITNATLLSLGENDINPGNNQASLTINTTGSGGSTSVPNQKVPILGTSGNDNLVGTFEPDLIYGLTGNDTIAGIGESDTIYGNQDDDVITGNQTNDLIIGGKGNDLLLGGKGNDQIYGDVGNDTLIGDLGQDILVGGPDFDIFVLPTKTAAATDYLADTILDFQVGVDIIALTDGLTVSNLILIPVNNNTAIQIVGNNQILGVVAGVSPSQLSNSFV